MPISCSDLRNRLNRRLLEHNVNVQALAEAEAEVESIRSRRDVVVSANQVLSAVFVQVQENVHRVISDIVTRCLRAVFGEDAYECRIVFEQKRNKTEARLELVRDGVSADPLQQVGGGVLDVASFGLRLAAILLSHVEKRRHVLILDEMFRFVSVDYRGKIRELIEQLASELDFQFIMVTHASELEIGDVVHLGG